MGHQKPSAEITHNCIFFLRSHSHIYPNNRTHIFVHTFMFLCTLTSIRTYMSVRTPSHIYLDTCMHVFTFSGCLESWVTRLYISMRTHLHIYSNTCTHFESHETPPVVWGIYICRCIHIYMSICAHTRICISTHTLMFLEPGDTDGHLRHICSYLYAYIYLHVKPMRTQ